MIEYFKNILTDRKNIAKVNEFFYPIYVVIYDKKYIYHEDLCSVGVMIFSLNGEVLLCVPANLFLEETTTLMKESNNSGDKISIVTTFVENLFRNNVKDTSKFKSYEKIFWLDLYSNHIGNSKLKADSHDKSDIHIAIRDQRTKINNNTGFSIKSQLGSPSSLLNAGIPTNFLYKVSGCDISDSDIIAINSINSHHLRMQELLHRGASIEYVDVENRTFKNNLLFMDCCMPQFIGLCLLQDSLSKSSLTVKQAVENVTKLNPLGFEGDDVLSFYEHKMKVLLLDAALGMTPAKERKGLYDANGGYLVVRKDGEIVCYHFYNRNDVEDYLFNNTRFEKASRSRYNYGSIFRSQSGDIYLRLNLQIRFKK